MSAFRWIVVFLLSLNFLNGFSATQPGTRETCSPPVPMAADKALDPNKPAGAPSEEAVKALLEKFWGRERVKNTFNYQSMKYGKGRKGEYRTDGVPANSNTMVFPIKVVCEHVVEYQDGSKKSETKSQQFVFFQDEFGEWTYRFKGNS